MEILKYSLFGTLIGFSLAVFAADELDRPAPSADEHSKGIFVVVDEAGNFEVLKSSAPEAKNKEEAQAIVADLEKTLKDKKDEKIASLADRNDEMNKSQTREAWGYYAHGGFGGGNAHGWGGGFRGGFGRGNYNRGNYGYWGGRGGYVGNNNFGFYSRSFGYPYYSYDYNVGPYAYSYNPIYYYGTGAATYYYYSCGCG